MLSFFRSFAKSWVSKIMFAILIVSFGLIFNIRDFIGVRLSHAAIVAGSHEVQPPEFRRIFDNWKKGLEQEKNGGKPIPIEEFTKGGLHLRLAEEIATGEAFAEWSDRIGLKPSKSLVAEQLHNFPDFFNPVTGAFDQDQYRRQLAARNVSEKEFADNLKEQIVENQWRTGMAAAARVPRIYGALQQAFSMETRDAVWFAVDPRVAGVPARPTDAQLQSFVSENAARFRRPEFRTGTIVIFTARDMVDKVRIDPAEVERRFAFQKDSLSTPETRSFVQVSVPNAQAAQTAAQALRNGVDANAAARANKGQAIFYENKPKTAAPDPVVADAAFALKPGDVSNPIQGRLGWAVVKVNGVTPGHQADLSEARAAIEAKLKQEQATDLVFDQVTRFEEARKAGASIAEAARKVGAKLAPVPPVTKDGRLPNGQRYPAPPQVLETLYAQPKGGESDVEDVGQAQYFALRTEDVLPSSLPKLEEMRPALTQLWMQQEMVRRMQEKAAALAERIAKGEAIAAVAASVGAPLRTATGIERENGSQGLTSPMIGQIFTKKRGETFTAPSPFGMAVGQVSALHAVAPVVAARAVEDARPSITLGVLEGVGGLAREAIRKDIKVRIDKDKINAALGVETPKDAKADPRK